MTRDEILNMEAGREMDWLIAEKVLGMERIHSKDFDIFQNEEWYLRDWEVPHYSENIEMAWTDIVEKSKLIEISNAQIYSPDEWECTIAFDGYQYSAEATTAPLAICRAALLAKLED